MLLGITGLVGCNLWERDQSSPSTPIQAQAEHLGNFSAGQELGDQWSIYIGDGGMLSLNVPIPADYLLTYTTNLGTFYIVFQATEKALMNIGLTPGDKVQEVSIQRGTIFESARTSPNVWKSGAVTLFAWPGGGATSWSDIFLIDGEWGVLVLVRDGKIADGVRKLPEPEPPAPMVPTSCVLAGSAALHEWKHWTMNGMNCPATLSDHCDLEVDNIGGVPITVTFNGGNNPGTRVINPGGTDGTYGFSAADCPLSVLMTPPPCALSGSAALYQSTGWYVNGTTCAAIQSNTCGARVTNAGSTAITVAFSGGINPGTRVINPGAQDWTNGYSAADCPASWTLAP